MYPHTFLWHYLWLAPHALQIAIAAVMIRRRLVAEYPVFFIYTVFEVVQGITLFALDHSSLVAPEDYWKAHWTSLALSGVLRFALIYEICSHIFHNYLALEKFIRLLYRWVAVILFLVAAVISAYAPTHDRYWYLTGMYAVNRAVSLIQIGLLVFLFAFSAYFRSCASAEIRTPRR